MDIVNSQVFGLGFLAFGWGAPVLLWWLALGAAPILIHFLSRRRYRETDWAAMRFLLEAVRKNSKRLRLEQLILMAVRAAIMVLVVLALAQLLFDDVQNWLSPKQPIHRILVIDASASMGFTRQEESLFRQAQRTARSIVEQAKTGDPFHLVRLSNLPPTAVISQPAFESARVVSEIEQMSLSHGVANVGECLEQVAALLKQAPEITRKEVYIISDFQRTSWSGMAGGDEELGRIKSTIRKLEGAAKFVLIDLGDPELGNVAVTRLESADQIVTTTSTVALRGAVRNFSAERVIGRQMELLVDGKVVEQRMVDLPAGAEVEERFSTHLAAPGERRVQLRLQHDSFPLDDERWLVLPVREKLRVLCVDGGLSRSAAGRATDYLELALSPESRGSRVSNRPNRSPIEPTTISDGEFQNFDLTGYDCIFFCNVRRFTEREAADVEAFLNAGGSAVWCLGDQVSADNYNQVLYRQGAGCLPARLGNRKGDPVSRETIFGFDAGDFSHPIVAPFDGNPGAGLERTPIYGYFQVVLPNDPPAQIALWYDSKEPAIIERRFGRGRALLITTSVDEQWGAWALWPSFLPVIQETTLFAVSGRSAHRQRTVGEPLVEMFPATAAEVDAVIGLPGGNNQATKLVRDGGTSEFQFSDTAQTGIYSVEFGPPISRDAAFAVNLDSRESDPAKLTRDELAMEHFAGVDFTYQTQWNQQVEAPASELAAPHGSASRCLLYAVLYLMFTEQLLAWDFRRGLWLLCPVLPILSRFWKR